MDYIDSRVIIAAYFPDDTNHKIAEKYFEELKFMNSCTSLAISRGLSGADSIHAISSLSISEVKKFITLDSHFRKISDLIEVIKPDGSKL